MGRQLLFPNNQSHHSIVNRLCFSVFFEVIYALTHSHTNIHINIFSQTLKFTAAAAQVSVLKSSCVCTAKTFKPPTLLHFIYFLKLTIFQTQCRYSCRCNTVAFDLQVSEVYSFSCLLHHHGCWWSLLWLWFQSPCTSKLKRFMLYTA